MRLRYKSWARPLVAAHHEIALSDEDLEQLPPFSHFEIGSGCGEFLIQEAINNPTSEYLGVEVAFTAFAICIKKCIALEKCPANLHFINSTADKVIPHLKPNSLDAIYLNFDDPWPKLKHHKRRLTYPTMLQKYYDLLKQGGQICFKSDNDLYFADSVDYFKEFQKFEYTSIEDYQQLDQGDVMSEYERKFRAKGAKIHRIVAIKRS